MGYKIAFAMMHAALKKNTVRPMRKITTATILSRLGFCWRPTLEAEGANVAYTNNPEKIIKFSRTDTTIG